MRKTMFLLVIFSVMLISCKKEIEPDYYKSINFDNLRNKPYSLLTIVDKTQQIITLEGNSGLKDSIGETVVFFRNDLLVSYNWEKPYMSPFHSKTDIFYAYNNDVVIVLIRPGPLFFDRMYIINHYLKEEFKVNFGQIKSAEINIVHKVVRITYNNSWTRSGPVADGTKEFNY